jgi:protein Tex
MSQLKSVSPEILLHIATVLNIPIKGLTAVIELLNEGGTVPFIARYRKEATGNLAERRETILKSIGEQGKLTPELRARIKTTLDKSELEDLYLPYRPKRRTKAAIAREKGLEPLALHLWAQEPGPAPLQEFAASFIDPATGRRERRRGVGRRSPHPGRHDRRERRFPQRAPPDDVR